MKSAIHLKAPLAFWALTHSIPDQHDGESIVILGSIGMVFQILSQKQAHMLELPGLKIFSLPSLSDGRLHNSSLK